MACPASCRTTGRGRRGSADVGKDSRRRSRKRRDQRQFAVRTEGSIPPAVPSRIFRSRSSSEEAASESVRAGGLEHYARRSRSTIDSRSCNDHTDLRVVVFPSAPVCSRLFPRFHARRGSGVAVRSRSGNGVLLAAAPRSDGDDPAVGNRRRFRRRDFIASPHDFFLVHFSK